MSALVDLAGTAGEFVQYGITARDVAGAVQAGATVASTINQYRAGRDASDIAEQNMNLTRIEAENTLKEYSFEAEGTRTTARKAVAALRAQEANSGFAQSGTAAWLQQDTMSEYEKDAMAIMAQGLSKSKSLMQKANIYGKQADTYLNSGYWNASGTLLNGVSNAIKIN
jgi:hypothetical protein